MVWINSTQLSLCSVRLKNPFSEYEFLHQLPADLLQDIESEPYESSARTDMEAVNAFRKIYDDFFERIRYSTALAGPQTGRKRVPPTKPYVLFLFLYDQLKRDAKRLNLQDFEVKLEKKYFSIHFFLFTPSNW